MIISLQEFQHTAARESMKDAALSAVRDFMENEDPGYEGTYTGIYLRVRAVLQAQDKIARMRAEVAWED
jgi:hypothetical protein